MTDFDTPVEQLCPVPTMDVAAAVASGGPDTLCAATMGTKAYGGACGGIEKLLIEAALGVKEVWVWDCGVISAHVLRGSTFVRSARSTLLPSLDLKRLAKHASMQDQSKAVRAFLKKR